MKNTPTTIEAMAVEIAAHEKEAANKRAVMLAAQEVENQRRNPLNLLLQARLHLISVITRNESTISAHSNDAREFEKLVDDFFQHESGHQTRTYSFLVATHNFPLAAASRAVELLTVRLDKAKNELTQLEVKIVAEADSLGLKGMLPAELLK